MLARDSSHLRSANWPSVAFRSVKLFSVCFLERCVHFLKRCLWVYLREGLWGVAEADKTGER